MLRKYDLLYQVNNEPREKNNVIATDNNYRIYVNLLAFDTETRVLKIQLN